jgi:hypothetical protein
VGDILLQEVGVEMGCTALEGGQVFCWVGCDGVGCNGVGMLVI